MCTGLHGLKKIREIAHTAYNLNIYTHTERLRLTSPSRAMMFTRTYYYVHTKVYNLSRSFSLSLYIRTSSFRNTTIFDAVIRSEVLT